MAQVYYDANGNPVILPDQQTVQPPPAADQPVPKPMQGALTGGQQGTAVQRPQQSPQQNAPAQNPLQGGASNISGGLENLYRLLGQNRNAVPQQVTGPTQQAALAQGTQVGPATPAPDVQTGVNTNQDWSAGVAGSGSSAGTGPTAAQASAALGLISQASHVGDALTNYGATASWRPIQSDIPDPSQFISQEQKAQQQYDFQQYRIV